MDVQTALHRLASATAGLTGLVELMQLDAEPGSELARNLALAAESADEARSLIRVLVALEEAR